MSTKMFVFIKVSVAVFLLVMITATLVTFILPETYSSVARIKLQPSNAGIAGSVAQPSGTAVYDANVIQTEFAVIQSEKIINPVIELLDLNSKWAQKFHIAGKLKTAESCELLRHQIELRPEGKTGVIDIKVYSGDKNEAADIANALARAYSNYRFDLEEKLIKDSFSARAKEMNVESGTPILDRIFQIIDVAVPGNRPVRPNVPLDLFLGAVVGVFAALVVGGLVAFLAGRFLPKKPATV
jgi:uncharacterized protein involved in exopolysaccharide biosynthesis